MHGCTEGAELGDHELHGCGGDDDSAGVGEGEACCGAGEACIAARGAVEVWVCGAGGGEGDEVADATGLERAGGLEVVKFEEDPAGMGLVGGWKMGWRERKMDRSGRKMSRRERMDGGMKDE